MREVVRGDKHNLRKSANRNAQISVIHSAYCTDLCFAIFRFSQVVFVTSNNFTHNLLYYFQYCNRRKFRTQFNFVYFVLLAGSTKFSSIWKLCTHTSVCDITLAVRKFIAYESSRALEYEIFTRTKISAITVVFSINLIPFFDIWSVLAVFQPSCLGMCCFTFFFFCQYIFYKDGQIANGS